MKFLLEFNEFMDDSFAMDFDLVEELKEVLTEYLEDVVEEKLPEIKEGFIKPYLSEKRFYAFKYAPDEEDATGINCIFISKQSYLLPIDRLSYLVSKVDENLTCIRGYNADIIITHKKLIQKIEAYFRFADALDMAVEESDDGEGKWSKWSNAVAVEIQEVKSKEVAIQLWKIQDVSYPRLNINFYMPLIEDNSDDIIWDVYFTTIGSPDNNRFSKYRYTTPTIDVKSEEYKKQIEDYKTLIKKLEKSTNEVFIYNIYDSEETIIDEILSWLEKEIFPFFENDRTKKYDNLIQTLNNLDESGLEIEIIGQPGIGREFEVIVKWRDRELIMNLIYIYQTNSVLILDEFDKKIEECKLEELGETLFLIMIEI